MRLILSRKGFDSSSGGCPSPILPDGTMLSLPIPDRSSRIAYREIEQQGVNIGQLVVDLTGDPRRLRHFAHLDPDLDRDTWPRADGWRPLLGQTGAAQGHLRKQSVRAGDLFLFFGLFRRVERTRSGWRFVRQAVAKHVLWGWLQIGEIHTVDELASDAMPWARYHPHFQGKRDVNKRHRRTGTRPGPFPLTAPPPSPRLCATPRAAVPRNTRRAPVRRARDVQNT